MLKRAFFANSSGILLSRIFGFLRDMSMAHILGASLVADIFFVAFKLPNLFRRIFAEGAFSQSFLPSLVQSQKKSIFLVSVFLIFALSILILSCGVWVFSNFITHMLAYGFEAEKIQIARPIVAINFWYLELVFISTFLGTLLQYRNVFWVSAYNTTLLNVFMILALWISQKKSDLEILYFLSYSVLAAGVFQVLFHLYPLYQKRFLILFFVGFKSLFLFFKKELKPHIKNIFKRDIKNFLKQFFPAVIGSSTAQIAAFLDTLLASFLATGSISYLYYANRVFQLPLAIFAIAISTTLFPTISRNIINQNFSKARELLKKNFWILLILLLGSTVGGILLKNEIIFLLFERGAFSREDTLITANVFALYLTGLVPYGLSKLFSLWMYANHKQAQAAWISSFSLAIGTIFSISSIQFLGVYALTLSSSITGIVLFILTIRSFGFGEFFDMMKGSMLYLLLGFLILEIAAITYLRTFWQIS